MMASRQGKEDALGNVQPDSKSKTVIVVKRRKQKIINRQATVTIQQKSSSRKRGLPSIQPKVLAQAAAAAQEKKEGSSTDEFDDIAVEGIPCDTLLVIRGLQESANSYLTIPLQSSPFLRAVLECQVYACLQQQSSELQDLLDSQGLVRLRACSHPGMTDDILSVLLTATDYERGVRDAYQRWLMQSQSPIDHMSAIVDWFLRHVNDWSGRFTITEEDLQEAYERDPLAVLQKATNRGQSPLQKQSPPLSQVIDSLQRLQVLLPSHHHAAYQLWLPEWGTVLKAWQKARTQLLAHIKRSYKGERSVASSMQQYSPIPTPLLIEWLKCQGIVLIVERPSGTFLRLGS
jgi:hypothetical protein